MNLLLNFVGIPTIVHSSLCSLAFKYGFQNSSMLLESHHSYNSAVFYCSASYFAWAIFRTFKIEFQANLGWSVQVNLFHKHSFFHQLNPKYDGRFFIELRVHYEIITMSVHHVYTKLVLELRTIFVHNLYWTCFFHVLKL